jgi:hypothetical protein
MRLSTIVEKSDVEEANRIFEVSTMESLKSDFPISIDPARTLGLIEIEDQINREIKVNEKILIAHLE